MAIFPNLDNPRIPDHYPRPPPTPVADTVKGVIFGIVTHFATNWAKRIPFWKSPFCMIMYGAGCGYVGYKWGEAEYKRGEYFRSFFKNYESFIKQLRPRYVYNFHLLKQTP
jgi:hypothetical protein